MSYQTSWPQTNSKVGMKGFFDKKAYQLGE